MLRNKLQINDGQIELLLNASPYFRKTTTSTHIDIGNDNVSSGTTDINFGVVLDQHMNFEDNTNNIRRLFFQHPKWIGDIRKYITEDAAKQLVHAFIISGLDNENSLPHGLPISTISHLQKIQNSTASLITHTPKFESITSVLRNMHWLPIGKIIMFKISVLTFLSVLTILLSMALHGTAPQYPYYMTDTEIVIQDRHYCL